MRTIGIVGSIVFLIGTIIDSFLYLTGIISSLEVSYLGKILMITGSIIILGAIKKITDKIQNDQPFTHYLTFVIIWAVASLLPLIMMILPNNLTNLNQTASSLIILTFILPIVIWILFIVAANYLKKSFKELAESTNTGIFKTTGIVFLIGTAFMFIFGLFSYFTFNPLLNNTTFSLEFIGGIFLIISTIIQTTAFTSLKEDIDWEKINKTTPKSSLKTTSEKEKRVCLSCGRFFLLEYIHCPYCGKPSAIQEETSE